ncbi:SLC13/DASS family transporter [Sedimentibacter hydroxybenzoicus DSM 7310]|uniref:SLC13/DASS family transporter n=1 Tax=Sedimentibacter hydroxybenzoicus DSM 7310 TaxID=1123245 RepID=A0A974BHD9_SEDHY|nr:SLC13 family permease [Sedimentibacter hydroxybenzoicus]NYB72961.1 SLC13/DASS family transporter [Sedimentibacter hydroxybenzoicus DSM 7310]
MYQSTIAIIVMVLMLIMYAIPKIPLSVTTIFAVLTMAFTGIISFEDAFIGFASPSVMLIAGMMIIGQSFFTSGLAQKIGNLLYKYTGADEKKFVTAVIYISSGLAIFLNGALVVAMLMPIINSVVSQSDGKISRKQTYFPLGIAATIGNNLTTISATSMITASGLISAAGYGELSIFAPTIVNLPALIVVIIIYISFGYSLQKKWFDFEEVNLNDKNICDGNERDCPVWKMVLTGIVMLVAVMALVMGINYGAVALAGSAILIFAGCISEKEAFDSISWCTIVIVAGAIGVSKGLDSSGAGKLIASFIINLCGPVGQSALGMCVILFIIGSVLSNLMSDNATVALLVPIAIVMAETVGISPIPVVLAAASGIKVAVATPISVAPMTMIQIPGYRFKDYLRIGGLINIVSMIVTCIAIKFVYFS